MDNHAEEPQTWEQAVKEHRRLVEEKEETNRRLAKAVLDEYEDVVSYLHGLQILAFEEHAKARPRRPDDGAISMLGFRAANDLLAAWNLLLCGYYVAVNTVVRSVYEAWISILYFSEYPDQAEIWWKMNPRKREEQSIRVGQMRARLIKEEKLEKEHKLLYSAMSQMAHPTADSMYPGLERQKGESEPALRFIVVGNFDETKVMNLAKLICINSVALTNIMYEVMHGNAVEQTPCGTMDKLRQLLDAIAERLHLHDVLGVEPSHMYGIVHGLDEELFSRG